MALNDDIHCAKRWSYCWIKQIPFSTLNVAEHKRALTCIVGKVFRVEQATHLNAV